MNNENQKTTQRKFRVTKEEDERLKLLANQRGLSISEYIRQCTLNENTIPVIDKAPIILQHLASLSTLMNSLEYIPKESDNTIELMQEEVKELWQSLK